MGLAMLLQPSQISNHRICSKECRSIFQNSRWSIALRISEIQVAKVVGWHIASPMRCSRVLQKNRATLTPIPASKTVLPVAARALKENLE